MRRWLFVIFAACASACTGGREDGREDVVTRADTTVLTTDVVSPSDSEVVPTDADVSELVEAGEPVCGEPGAQLYGDLVWTDRSGLYAAAFEAGDVRVLDTWTASAASGPALAPTRDGGIELLVAVADDLGCTLRGYDRDGANAIALARDATPCFRPSIVDRVAWWPAGNGVMRVPLDGSPTSRVALASPVSTALVPAGERDGGGTHWLVGAGDAIVWLDDLTVRTSTAETAAVRALVPLDDCLVVAALGTVPEDGFGARLQLLNIADGDIANLGPPLETPAAILAHPITLSCDEVAGGGTHWWCPSALLAAAGDGWLRAWRMPEGAEVTRYDVADFAWTGIAFGGDGRIMGGGTHWIPIPNWELRQDDAAVSSGVGAACITSPVIDPSGVVAAPVLQTPNTVARTDGIVAGGATGWPRPGGADNAGIDDAPPCVDGRERSARVVDVAADVSLAMPFDDRVVVAGELGGPWLGFVDPDNRVRDEVTLGVSGGPVTALARDDDAVIAAWVDGDKVTLARRAADGTVVTASIGGLATPRVAGLSVEPIGVLAVIGSFTSEDLIVRYELENGATATGESIITPGPSGATLAIPTPGGLAIAGVDGNNTYVRGLDPEHATRFVRTFAGATPLPLDVDAVGSLQLLIQEMGSGRRQLVRLQADGVPIATLDVGREATTMAAALDGSALIGELTAVRRVGPQGSLGAARPGRFFFSLARADDGYFGFGVVTVGPDLTRIHLAELDGQGFSGCANSGRCVWSDDAICDEGDACASSGCAPATGACVSEPRTCAASAADLSTTITGAATAVGGGAVAYEVTVTNDGTVDAADVSVTIPTPEGTSSQNLSIDCQNRAGPSRVVCPLGTLGATASATVSFELVTGYGALDVTPVATAGTSSVEGSGTNNSAAVTTAVSAFPAVDIAIAPPLALQFNACSGRVYSFTACVPGSLIPPSDITLLDGGIVQWDAPGYAITWSQPDGPDSIRMDIVNELAPDDHLVYLGIGVSATCFEGTFYQLPGPDPIGAFSLCPP